MQGLSGVFAVFDTLTGFIPTANNDKIFTVGEICHFRHSVDFIYEAWQ